MVKTKCNLNVSIVIPVYNEEAHLGACLEAIAAQSVKPYEVIVVDNNSSDQTLQIAAKFSFVRILHEARQGVVFARDAGFAAARGDIIGRIDGDTVLAKDWIATLQDLFRDDSLDVVTGSVSYYDMAAHRLVDWIDLHFRRQLARLMGREVATQGANMALRRSVWQTIRGGLCHSQGVHEDFDLAIHANTHGFRVGFRECLRVGIAYRQAGYNFLAFCSYSLTSPHTYARHGLRSRRYMYPVVAFVIVMYAPITLLNRGYDAELRHFSWSTLLSLSTAPRVNPATFVD